jgi:hypothetical protein
MRYSKRGYLRRFIDFTRKATKLGGWDKGFQIPHVFFVQESTDGLLGTGFLRVGPYFGSM